MCSIHVPHHTRFTHLYVDDEQQHRHPGTHGDVNITSHDPHAHNKKGALAVFQHGHNSTCGNRWVQYWLKRQESLDQRLFPDVEVAIKIYKIANVDVMRGTYDCVFSVMLDWVDPTIEQEKTPGLTANQVIWEDHFMPKVEVWNADISTLETFSAESVFKLKEPRHGVYNHVTLTTKYQASCYIQLDFRQYPYDHQLLEIKLQVCTHTQLNTRAHFPVGHV